MLRLGNVLLDLFLVAFLAVHSFSMNSPAVLLFLCLFLLFLAFHCFFVVAAAFDSFYTFSTLVVCFLLYRLLCFVSPSSASMN